MIIPGLRLVSLLLPGCGRVFPGFQVQGYFSHNIESEPEPWYESIEEFKAAAGFLTIMSNTRAAAKTPRFLPRLPAD